MTTTLLLIVLGILLVALFFGIGAWRARRKRDFAPGLHPVRPYDLPGEKEPKP